MAGRFPSEWIDEVRDRSDIVSIVSEYVTLQRKGSKHWGLCPFHGEKTPSFSVDQEKQMYYCFGCHAGGNVITFVMAMERMEFPEAVRHLAERAHMPIPETTQEESGPKKDKDRLYAALVEAAKFFNRTLYTPDGAQALEYLHGRGIRDNVIRRFGLGCTAKGWQSLHRYLSEMGFTDQEMMDANLILERGGKVFDTFRDRVMFPIFDPRGRVIAFGGRVMGDGQPKYLNSSDTPVFNKRKNVYGLNFLKGGKRSYIRLVEGYMDVVSLYQHGVDGCVATLGTALTNEQIRLMKRYAPQVLITYDGDGAGQRAISRGLDLFDQENVSARVTVVPDKMDPDEYVRAKGGQALNDLGSVDPTTYRLDTLAASHDLSDAEERTKYAVEAAQVLRRLENPVEVERFLKRLTIETGFSEETLYEQVGRRRAAKPEQPTAHTAAYGGKNSEDDGFIRAEKELIAMLAVGEKVPRDLLRMSDFTDPACAYMAKILLEENGDLHKIQSAMEQMEDEQMRGDISRILLIGQIDDRERRVRMITDCIDRLHMRRVEKDIDQCETRLNDKSLTPQEQMELVVQLNSLYDKRERLKTGRG